MISSLMRWLKNQKPRMLPWLLPRLQNSKVLMIPKDSLAAYFRTAGVIGKVRECCVNFYVDNKSFGLEVGFSIFVCRDSIHFRFPVFLDTLGLPRRFLTFRKDNSGVFNFSYFDGNCRFVFQIPMTDRGEALAELLNKKATQ